MEKSVDLENGCLVLVKRGCCTHCDVPEVSGDEKGKGRKIKVIGTNWELVEYHLLNFYNKAGHKDMFE